ncbi:MAG: 4Fe-4S binding protein [Candidatus Neomarinimicrobiota bacterium]
MIQINSDHCDLCGTCLSVCPVDCIELTETKLNIDESACTKCQLCVRICPFKALKLVG